MPEVAFCILIALLEHDEATARQMSVATGYDVGKYMRPITQMMLLGWVVKPWNGVWKITERGKIVLAIETGRRSRRRRSGLPWKRFTLRKFLEMETSHVSPYKGAAGRPGTDVAQIG
jgi:hypothetical protein